MTKSTLPPGAIPAGEQVQSEHHLRLEPIPRLVGQARAFVGEHTPALDASTHDSLVLLTSELVTNVVIHARTPLIVGITVTPAHVIVTVHDLDLGHSELEPTKREGGRGLVLVEALAQASGSYRDPEGGKTAWFRLDRDAAPPPADSEIDALLDRFDP